MPRQAATFAAFAVLLGAASGKVMSGTLRLDGETPEHYISKFSINTLGSMSGHMETVNGQPFNTGSIALFIFDAEDWPEYQKKVTCMDRARLAKSRFSIGNNNGDERTAQQELEDSYRIKSHGGRFDFQRAIKPEDGEILYVVIADCSLEQVFHNIPEISYEVTLINGESGHIPAEEYLLPEIYTLMVILLSGVMIYGLKLVKEQQATLGAVHLITKLLMLAFWLNFASTLLESINLFWYRSFGTGHFMIDLFAELFNAGFVTTVNFVLLALACGWTLTDSSAGSGFMVAFRDPSKLFTSMSSSSVVVCLFTISFVIVEVIDVFTSSRDDDFAKFHEHDTAAGKTLMLMHIAFCGLFFFSITATRKLVAGRQKDFLSTLAVSGATWFLTTPVLVLIAPFVAKVVRHRMVTAGTLALQSVTLLVMCRLFLTRSSEYFKLSSMGNMGTMLGLASEKPTGGNKAID